MKVDVVIFGGGGAGLWLLDVLCGRGLRVVLVEKDTLGGGQTVGSQGIIHGGMKYAITGSQRASATAIREMPEVWRECIAGRSQPDLRGTPTRSACCFMWRTTSLKSTLGMLGARVGLRSNAEKVEVCDRPVVLQACPGDVFRLDEQVIDTVGFVRTLAERHERRLLSCAEVEFVRSDARDVSAVVLRHPRTGETLRIDVGQVVLTAGAGNAGLRELAGLSTGVMQRRPLHMAMVRGDLPNLFGHCIDGAHTRVTVTSARDARGEMVWQVGGQVAEDGVSMSAAELVEHVRRELVLALPGVNFHGCAWSTYRIDRGEGFTDDGGRPSGPVVLRDGNVITAWPTKLALLPHLAMLVSERLGACGSEECDGLEAFDGWLRPEVSLPPWDCETQWVTLD